jgi:hypothetical protein
VTFYDSEDAIRIHGTYAQGLLYLRRHGEETREGKAMPAAILQEAIQAIRAGHGWTPVLPDLG